MANEMSVSRSTIYTCLAELGLKPRSGSEAMYIRMANLSFEGRQKLARAANQKARNSGRQRESSIKAAKVRQTRSNIANIGKFEQEICEHLIACGIELIP